jgi:N-acetylglucosaminyldiphosphoundecaprenol N-acetyl-beta-D-mannosaminyltransferase
MTEFMDRPTTQILGVPISTLGMERTLEFCAAQAKRRGGGYVCFANVHSVTESQSEPTLKSVFSRALLSVADGLPLVWVSRLRGPKIESRVCGPDFMKFFLERHRELSVGFIGGGTGQAERLAKRFGLTAPCLSPPMRPYSAAAAQEDWRNFLALNPNGPPQVVWVGLGAPKQELWMSTVSALAPETLFFGVGAAFDFLTGQKRRAPVWMQKSGLEWFFRLVQEPRRLWKRYFSTNGRFVVLVLRDLLHA